MDASHVQAVAVRLGGTFAVLGEQVERDRVLLQQADALVAAAEARLHAERQKCGDLTSALEKAGRMAAAAELATGAARSAAASVESDALSACVAAAALASELRERDDAERSLCAELSDSAASLESTEGLLDEARSRCDALTAALASRDAALDAAAGRERELCRSLDEERQRCKRLAAARVEKEKQLAVALSEKNRLSALLSKKDTLARDLTTALKVHERTQVQAQAHAQQRAEHRRKVRMQAAMAIGEDAADKAIVATISSTAEAEEAEEAAAAGNGVGGASVQGRRRAGQQASGGESPRGDEVAAVVAPAGAWPAQSALHVSPRIPGVQSRFEGWRDASPAQRGAALRTENAMLLQLLAERDAALAAASQENRSLRTAHATMLTRWRGAAQARRTEPSGAATPSVAATTAPPKVGDGAISHERATARTAAATPRSAVAPPAAGPERPRAPKVSDAATPVAPAKGRQGGDAMSPLAASAAAGARKPASTAAVTPAHAARPSTAGASASLTAALTPPARRPYESPA